MIHIEKEKTQYCQEYSQICHVESLCMFSYQNGCTALYVASQNGHLAVVTALVNGGADLNLQSKVSTRIYYL
jgi:ankyrin repeat protein